MGGSETPSRSALLFRLCCFPWAATDGLCEAPLLMLLLWLLYLLAVKLRLVRDRPWASVVSMDLTENGRPIVFARLRRRDAACCALASRALAAEVDEVSALTRPRSCLALSRPAIALSPSVGLVILARQTSTE